MGYIDAIGAQDNADRIGNQLRSAARGRDGNE